MAKDILCVALLPVSEVTCGRPMKFVRDTFTDRRHKCYIFRCPRCTAIRVVSDDYVQRRRGA